MKRIILLMLLIIVTGGCGKEEKDSEVQLTVDYPTVWNEFVDKLQAATSAGIADDVILPEWLLSSINSLDRWCSLYISVELPLDIAEIYQGEFNNQVIYYYYSYFNATGNFDILYEDGDYVEGNRLEFYIKSKNWKLIYECMDESRLKKL